MVAETPPPSQQYAELLLCLLQYSSFFLYRILMSTALAHKFNAALAWNASTYFLYKLLSFVVSLMAFQRLSTPTFCLWNTVNSTVFVFVLWTECGLRKTIPRYLVAHPYSRSLHTLLGIKALIMLGAAPIFIATMQYLYTCLGYTTAMPHELIAVGTTLFITESILSVVELMFHAHFRHKIFNTVSMISLTITMCMSIAAVLSEFSEYAIVLTLISLRLLHALTVILITICIFLVKSLHTPAVHAYRAPELTLRTCITHTSVVWTTTMLKSLTERNVLIPFLALAIDQHTANIVKVAHDASLLFYRVIIKTIGSSDTTLLAHAQRSNDEQVTISTALAGLVHKISLLCCTALIGIIGASLYAHVWTITHSVQLQLFLIFSISYVLEILLSPAERMLEVYAHYRQLMYAYIPYTIMVIILAGVVLLGFCTDTLWIVVVVQTIRLGAAGVMLGVFYKNVQWRSASVEQVLADRHNA